MKRGGNASKPVPPNIVVILADDMGFADLGCTGSEIRTPNLDRLARDGVLCTSMYNAARCCPSRASLLTGLYPHDAGIGHMGADLGTPAYRGRLRDDAATIAEHLRAAGYATLMAGKWHVGGDYPSLRYDLWRPGSKASPTPLQRGFDRFYGLLDGAAHFFSPHVLMDDDRCVDVPDGFYFTDAITDRAIGMVEGALKADMPFFLYLAHTAPHWPLHAPPEDIARYADTYAGGWDTTRTARHEEMNGLGVLQNPWDISPRDPEVHPWQREPNKDWQASVMATYAAMVDRMDQSIGRLLEALRAYEVLDNTLILFLSDNGGCAEFMAEDGWAQYYPDRTHDGQQVTKGNLPDLAPGAANTFQSYDRPWANVSNAPFRLFKHYVHEGGISTPLIAHWPNGFGPGGTVHAPCHLVDIVPTLLDAAGAFALTERDRAPVQMPVGESLLPLLQGRDWSRDAPIYFEHEGNAAVRAGPWKLVRRHGGPWEVYQMEEDRTELNNRASGEGARVSALSDDWQNWANQAGVLPWELLHPRLQAAWGLRSLHG